MFTSCVSEGTCLRLFRKGVYLGEFAMSLKSWFEVVVIMLIGVSFFVPTAFGQGEGQASEALKVYPIGKVSKKEGRSFIVLDKRYEPGLLGLDRLSSVMVIYWFDRNDTPQKRSILQVHPRGNPDNPLTGVFATHSPVRPNLLGVSRCGIIAVKDNVIEIDNIDAFDGSPVIDLKR